MPEFLTLLPPDDARSLLLSHLSPSVLQPERIDVISAPGRVLAEEIDAPHPLPDFRRSTVDGYAVRAADTHGASDALPAYLVLKGEVPMGGAPPFAIEAGECALIHTGGMLPEGSDAVVMLEHTQRTGRAGHAASTEEIEILRAAAEGENLIDIGEDVSTGQVVLSRGTVLRPAEIGGLMALGVASVLVTRKVKVGLISTGDEVIDPKLTPRPGQVRDVNSYSLGALVEKSGAEAMLYGVVSDTLESLREIVAQALAACDLVIITAGSSASTRDLTAQVVGSLGEPGVLVHGVNTRPGKPTILGVCGGKAVIGLPGNPVSALINGYLFVVPVIEKLLGAAPRLKASVSARLSVNLSSQAGREDWWPVRLVRSGFQAAAGSGPFAVEYDAVPIFGKSNLIFTLASADGLLRIPPDATGLAAGAIVDVLLL